MYSKYSPKADMLLVSTDAKKLRNNLTKFLPNIGLSMINYGRSSEIDKFYNICQQHRDYYKDHSGKIHKVPGFDFAEKQFASRPEPTSIYVKQPIYYMTERRPVVYPLTIERRGRPKNDAIKIDLKGTYYPQTCIKYKR